MPRIQIQILTGPKKGQRAVFEKDVVRFGRETDNDLQLDGKFLSRNHGELRFEDSQWVLHNESANGTELSGKRITKKPRPVNDRDMISIGKQPMFQVMFDMTALPTEQTESSQEQEASTADAAVSRKTKLWIGIGIYLVVAMVIFLLLSTLDKRKTDSAPEAPELTADQIRRDILTLPTGLAVDDRAAEHHLKEATQLFNRLDSSISAYYNCYENYQRALVHSGRDAFSDGLDQRRYQTVQQQLIDQVQDRYSRGYKLLRAADYARAEESFRSLADFYPKLRGEVFQNVERQRKVIQYYIKKQKRRM